MREGFKKTQWGGETLRKKTFWVSGTTRKNGGAASRPRVQTIKKEPVSKEMADRKRLSPFVGKIPAMGGLT